jgi:hypothetical protein
MPLPPNRENSRAGALPLFVARVRQIVHKVIKDVEIKRLARNVAWSSFGVVLSQVITFALACAYVAADSVQAIFVLVAHFRSERERAATIAIESQCSV